MLILPMPVLEPPAGIGDANAPLPVWRLHVPGQPKGHLPEKNIIRLEPEPQPEQTQPKGAYRL